MIITITTTTTIIIIITYLYRTLRYEDTEAQSIQVTIFVLKEKLLQLMP